MQQGNDAKRKKNLRRDVAVAKNAANAGQSVDCKHCQMWLADLIRALTISVPA
jgi:hypothetical protein